MTPSQPLGSPDAMLTTDSASVSTRRPKSLARSEKALALLLPLLVARPALEVVAATAAGWLNSPVIVWVTIVRLALASTALVSVAIQFRRLDLRVASLCWVIVFALLVGIARAGQFGEHYSQITVDVAFGLAWLVAAYALRDFQKCRLFLYRAAFLICVAAVIQTLLRSNSTGIDAYFQSLAYLLLPAVLIFIDAAFERFPLRNGLLALASGGLLLSMGARGPSLVVALFLLGRMILEMRRSRNSILFGLFGLGSLAAIWLLYDSVLTWLASVLASLGLSTRVVTLLISGTLLQDTARGSLALHTWGLIQRNPVFGVGMSNERPLLAEKMGRAGLGEELGWYPHNLFLELWVQYGVLVGSIVAGLVIYAVVRSILISDDRDRSAVLLIFVGIGLLPLMFSASYLSWPPFFALVGLSLASFGEPTWRQE